MTIILSILLLISDPGLTVQTPGGPAQPAGPTITLDGQAPTLRLVTVGKQLVLLSRDAKGELGSKAITINAGTALVTFRGGWMVNGKLLGCDKGTCDLLLAGGKTLMLRGEVGDDIGWRAIEKPTPKAARELLRAWHRARLEAAQVKLDLDAIRDELSREEEAFTETGLVSVEAGSACLDATSGDAGVQNVETPQTTVDKLPATLRVKVKITP